MTKRFPPAMLSQFHETKYLYIRSGKHRFIPIWVVVVNGRVIVRSWNDKAQGWYRAFLAEPRGEVRLGSEEVPVKAVKLRSAQVNDAADDAYGAKYTSKPNQKWVVGFKEAKRKACTLELVPA